MRYNSFCGGAITSFIVVLSLTAIYQACNRTAQQVVSVEKTEIKTDTLTKYIDSPEAKDSTVIRYLTVRVPVIDHTHSYVKDTAPDSTVIELPITQKTYEDSTYKAWVSGYMPTLDSIQVYQPVTTITKTITNTEIHYKTKHWGVGIQVGAGITPSRVEPYVGVGVTYNIFPW